VIEVVDRIKALLPQLPPACPLRWTCGADRPHATIRASVRDVQHELLLAMALVVAVIFVPAQRAGHAHSQRGGAAVAGRHLWRDVPAGLLASTTSR
jgi:hypothetical protein